MVHYEAILLLITFVEDPFDSFVHFVVHNHGLVRNLFDILSLAAKLEGFRLHPDSCSSAKLFSDYARTEIRVPSICYEKILAKFGILEADLEIAHLIEFFCWIRQVDRKGFCCGRTDCSIKYMPMYRYHPIVAIVSFTHYGSVPPSNQRLIACLKMMPVYLKFG